MPDSQHEGRKIKRTDRGRQAINLFVNFQKLCFRGPLTHLLLFCLMFIGVHGHAQVFFQYRHETGDKWHLTSIVDEEVLYDGELYHRVEILNKVAVEIVKGNGRDGLLKAHYQIAEKQIGKDFYSWSREDEVTYARDSRGRVSQIDKGSPFPAVRNVPVYPEEAISVSHTWEGRGQECFDLEPSFGISEIIKIEFLAAYEYEGPEIIDELETEKVSITYAYEWTPDSLLSRRLQRYQIYPVGIVGNFEQSIYWDAAAGKNYAEKGMFSYAYTMNDGHVYTFSGSTRGRAVYTKELDKEGIVRETETLDDVDATITDDGVRITLENIHFIPDSANFLPGEKSKLSKIASLLKRIPHRDLLIIGHTASVSPYNTGQKLSEERAGAVAQYLIDTGVRNSTQIITKGMGDRQPLAYNETEEGRKKNRRVEIIIMEN